MLKTEHIVVDDIRFETTQFPAIHSFELLARLIKSVGPAMGALSGMDQNADLSAVAPQLMMGFSSLNSTEASKLVVDVLASTTALVNNKLVPLNRQENIDLVFSGKLRSLFKVVFHALKVNYSDFLTENEPNQSPDQTPVNQ